MLISNVQCDPRDALILFDVSSIDETTFDVMCRICKRRLQADEGKLESESSSTSGESSSTESDKTPEPQEEHWTEFGTIWQKGSRYQQPQFENFHLRISLLLRALLDSVS